MNLVICSGYLTAEPELRKTPTGKDVCSFSVALRRGKDEVDFVPVVCWEATANFVAKHFHKGSGIELRAELRQNRWKDADGKGHSRLELYAREIEFPKGKKASASADAADAPEVNAEDYAILTEEDLEEALPF